MDNKKNSKEEKEQEQQEEMEEEESTSKKQRKDDEEDSDQDDDTQRNAFLQHILQAMITGRRTNNDNNNEGLIQGLKERGVLTNRRVEEALLKIPRGIFVPKDLDAEAYLDSPLRLPTFAFNISAPHMYAVCLEHLDLQPGMSFLDIGSGCGHFTALGGYLVGRYGSSAGFDLRDDIIRFAEDNMKTLKEVTGIQMNNVKFVVRNCFLPTAKTRKYDRIHVGACCPEAQVDNLLALLAPNGILVTPLGDKLVKFVKDEHDKVKTVQLMAVRYGDLIIPSKAEIEEAERELAREKATTIVIPPSTFPHDLMNLMNNKDLSDVTFLVEEKPVYAHKLILAARSEHFRAMFYNGLRESRESEVRLPDISYTIFLDCLKYIYTGEVSLASPDHAIDLIGHANYFKLERLKALCEDTIKENIEVENAAYILQIATRHAAWQLKNFALDFIMRNYAEVEKTKSFDELDKPLLLEVTKAACTYFQKK